LDGEGRLTVPAAFSEQMANGAYLTQGFDRNLLVLTAGAFQELYRRITGLNMADPLARALIRMLLGSAHAIPAEAAGAPTIPGELRAFAGLSGNALLVGQGDYLEVWSPESWNAQAAQLQDAEANAARFSMLDISTRKP
jgi:MraZ protein